MRLRASRRASKPSGAGSLASTRTSGEHAVQGIRGYRVARVAGHLAARMDAGVGPPGHREGHGLAAHRAYRLLDDLLDGPQSRLSRPAAEVGAVVLEQEARAHLRPSLIDPLRGPIQAR